MMKKSFKSFLINHTLVTVLLGVLFVAVKVLVPTFPIPQSVYIIFLFFYVFVLAVHSYMLKVAQKKPQVFIRTFMVMTFAKLFVYLAFISILLLLNRADAQGIIIVFATLYLINLVHELGALLKHLNQTQQESGKSPQK